MNASGQELRDFLVKTLARHKTAAMGYQVGIEFDNIAPYLLIFDSSEDESTED